MTGDVSNVKVWAEGDVALGSLASVNPVDEADYVLTGDDAWAFAGILDGAAGFGESQTNTNTDHTGWGYGVIVSSRKDLTITKSFTALEDNEATLGLRYDVSGVTFAGGGYSGDLAGRNLQEKFKAGFDVRVNGEMKRMITKNYAQIETLGDVTESEDGLAMLPVTLKIYPTIIDGKPVYWEIYRGALPA